MKSCKTLAFTICTVVLLVACGGAKPSSPTAPTVVQTPASAPAPAAPAPDVTFAGAGDIVRCNTVEAELTAKILDGIPGTVFSLGDNVYPSSTPELLAQCYAPTWGRHVGRMLATPGNHDWEVAGGAPYFAYFGGAAGSSTGYYSTTLGAWHVVSLNSNIAAGPGSPQYEWLKADLAASTARCTLAMWHHPMFSSGEHGNSPQMRDAWRLLQDHGASVVLNGHDHDYERFAQQDASGQPDPRGIREFVVGTGGAPLYARANPQPNTEAWDDHTFGVLRLTLKSDGYAWQFVPVAGQSFSDAGTAACVSAQPVL